MTRDEVFDTRRRRLGIKLDRIVGQSRYSIAGIDKVQVCETFPAIDHCQLCRHKRHGKTIISGLIDLEQPAPCILGVYVVCVYRNSISVFSQVMNAWVIAYVLRDDGRADYGSIGNELRMYFSDPTLLKLSRIRRWGSLSLRAAVRGPVGGLRLSSIVDGWHDDVGAFGATTRNCVSLQVSEHGL